MAEELGPQFTLCSSASKCVARSFFFEGALADSLVDTVLTSAIHGLQQRGHGSTTTTARVALAAEATAQPSGVSRSHSVPDARQSQGLQPSCLVDWHNASSLLRAMQVLDNRLTALTAQVHEAELQVAQRERQCRGLEEQINVARLQAHELACESLRRQASFDTAYSLRLRLEAAPSETATAPGTSLSGMASTGGSMSVAVLEGRLEAPGGPCLHSQVCI
mmetsp:Transcript_19114/g.48075  ORF Transcript_19114/g.48075 Transcript_19114/m.48075 type:complete len:220 (+) Transcript_19114:125-784(+)